ANVKHTLKPNTKPTTSPTAVPTPTPSSAPTINPLSLQSTEILPNNFCVRVPVVYYHHIQPLSIASRLGHAPLTVDSDIFDNQMAYLAQSGYHALSADDLVHALLNHQQIPGKNIVLTFDDGYDDMFSYAYS